MLLTKDEAVAIVVLHPTLIGLQVLAAVLGAPFKQVVALDEVGHPCR